MPIDYGVDVDGAGVMEDALPSELENKISLPNVNLDYDQMASVWEEYKHKVAHVEGWGAKTFLEGVEMVHYHVKLAGSHLEKVRTSLATLNNEVRQRAGAGQSMVAQRKVFTNFFTKMSDEALDGQLSLFNVQPEGGERTKQQVINDIVEAAMAVNGGDA